MYFCEIINCYFISGFARKNSFDPVVHFSYRYKVSVKIDYISSVRGAGILHANSPLGKSATPGWTAADLFFNVKNFLKQNDTDKNDNK